LRDVTYSSLLKRERRIYHGRAARWLETVTTRNQRSTEFTMLIAEHYESAGESGQAAEWYLRAGRAAAVRFANNEAVRALSRALELFPKPNPQWKFTVLLEREKANELLGKRHDRLADLDAMQAAAESSGDPSLLAISALQWAQYASQTADFSGAIKSARHAEELAEGTQNLELAAQSVLLQASITMRQGAFELSEQHAQRALTLTSKQELPDIQANGYRHLGLVAFYTETLSLRASISARH
jgi:tetratricopeptide (TPR) repeat protein